MKCIGRTKDKRRCKNEAKFIVCQKHYWQPFSLFFIVISAVGFAGGFFQDIVSPMTERLAKNTEMKKEVTVEIKRNRRHSAEWEKDLDPTNGKSDVITILKDRQLIKSLEIYHTAKDQRFKDYPFTAPLAENFIPTSAEYSVIDLDKDGVNEIVITLTNQIYGVHYDKQINVLIYNPAGELVARTPYPRDIPGLKLEIHNPYSAYRTTAIMADEISGSRQNSTFANGFEIISRENMQYLQFSWVIDNGSYVGDHLHQVEEFQYDNGKLIPLQTKPSLHISSSWEQANVEKPIESIQQAQKFLAEINNPSFAEMAMEMEKKLSGTSLKINSEENSSPLMRPIPLTLRP